MVFQMPRWAVAKSYRPHVEYLDIATKNKAVFGIYSSVDQAERAVNVLVAEAFASQVVSVLMPDLGSTGEFAHHKDTKVPEVATAGAAAGGVVGNTLGVLIGLGTLAVPGLDLLLAASPIVAGLAGLCARGATP